MSKGAPVSYSLDLFAESEAAVEAVAAPWPAPARFPLNTDTGRVGDVVVNDLRRSENPLVVTGYAALDRLIDFIADCPESTHIRLLFGFEPFPSRRETFEVSGRSFTAEMQAYWLEHGISLLLSAKLIHCIERLKSGRVEARYLGGGQRLHAKIYCGDDAATVGSSNFTRPGLDSQLEANTRFTRKGESARYEELVNIAENYWALGRDYNQELIDLLEQLLRVVPWQEALARASAELLEGEWARAYLRREYLPLEAELWPSQKQGIAQALYILSHQGSVLVADATGSGKTRMGVHLVRAVRDDILRSGRLRQGKALMVAPPAVRDSWERESHFSGTQLDIYSHGMLSHSQSGKHDLVIEALRRAQILCVDEGHNFLNIGSNRTQHLLRNMADHVMLFTATPINRSVVDLLRIVDMLGADNLDDSTLKAFRKLLGVRKLSRSLTDQEIDSLRQEIQRFTVRRTKKMLNGLIERDPEHYVDKDGRPCRFPRHRARIYSLDEPARDREIAARIRGLADELYGVSHFVKPIEMPEVLHRQGVTEETYLRSRLSSANKIAKYVISASLRSSRVALAEHLVGSREAIKAFGIKGFSKHQNTGNVIARLDRIRESGPPENRLNIPLPDWLSDPDRHAAACDHDQRLYRRIYELLDTVSDHREVAKAERLVKLLKQHGLVLAFDSRPITLADLRQRITNISSRVEPILATGDPGSQRSAILEQFRLGSEARNVIGLCSDSLAEGVNLQQASALMHLDMPSVVRIAEQRAGRVDRMDSPHESVEVWWPEDAPEFAISSDERFIERYETVDRLLGSNLPLPEGMHKKKGKPLSARELVEQYEKEMGDKTWDGVQDAFEPVRSLVSGARALVDDETYEHYRHVRARVLSRVSLVRADSPWAFFCIAAGAFGAPRWILLPSFMGRPISKLDQVCEGLRERLGEGVENLAMNDMADEYLRQFLGRLSDIERALLPRKKQRALEEMDFIITQFSQAAIKRGNHVLAEHYGAILDMLRKPNPQFQPDWDEVAGRWLDVIRPTWYEKLKEGRRKGPLLLKDIRKSLLVQEAGLSDEIMRQFRSFPLLPPPDERISACIIGISE